MPSEFEQAVEIRRLFDAGLNTAQIGAYVNKPEHEVDSILHRHRNMVRKAVELETERAEMYAQDFPEDAPL